MDRILNVIEWNVDSIILALAIAALTGPVFALTHEGTKWIIRQWQQRKSRGS